MKNENRRLVNVPLSFELIVELMYQGYSTNGVVKTTKGIPEGSALVNVSYDGRTSTAYFTFYHESFDHVPLGNVIPEFFPVHMTSTYIYNEEALSCLYDLVQGNQKFFNCLPGDDVLEKAVEKLKRIVE